MTRRSSEKPDHALWEASKEIACAVAATCSAEEMGQALMDELHGLEPCDLGSILTAAPGQEWSIVGQISDNAILQRNLWPYAGEVSASEFRKLVGQFTVGADVFDSRRRERLSLFRNFLTPQRLNHLVCSFWVMDGRMWAVGLTRESSAFSDRGRARLGACLA